MAFKTFAPGVLTSSDVNTFLMRQAVITCTSSTRPASPSEGMTIYETDTDLVLIYTGTAWKDAITTGAWKTYTPAIRSTGSGTDWVAGNANVTGAYAQFGTVVTGYALFRLGSTSVAGSKSLNIDAPIPYAGQATGAIGLTTIGDSLAYDESLGTGYSGNVKKTITNGETIMKVQVEASSGTYLTNADITSTIPFTWTNLDRVIATFTYEVA